MKNKIVLFCLLQTYIFALSTIDLGDKEFVNKNYKQALKYYLENEDTNKTEIKLSYFSK